jgi:hypothetical protein
VIIIITTNNFCKNFIKLSKVHISEKRLEDSADIRHGTNLLQYIVSILFAVVVYALGSLAVRHAVSQSYGKFDQIIAWSIKLLSNWHTKIKMVDNRASETNLVIKMKIIITLLSFWHSYQTTCSVLKIFHSTDFGHSTIEQILCLVYFARQMVEFGHPRASVFDSSQPICITATDKSR